jgi:plasmid replication initiation protein
MSKIINIADEDVNKIKIVKKSNQLVRSFYDLSLTEQRIIAMAIAYIEDETDRKVLIPLASYKRFLDIERVDLRHINNVLKVLRSNSIVFVNPKDIDKLSSEVNKATVTGWVDNLYVDNGYLKIEFNENVWNYIVDLKKDYTSYQLKTILKLGTKSSLRLYEIFKSYAYRTCEQLIRVSDLRAMLMLDQKYQKLSDFKKQVLDPAIKEINAILAEDNITKITYDSVKNGRTVEYFKFYLPKMTISNDSNVEPSDEVKMVMSMSDNDLFIAIKFMIMKLYKVKFSELDKDWNECTFYTKYALATTYLGLSNNEWENHSITNAKAFFAEHLRRESEKGA